MIKFKYGCGIMIGNSWDDVLKEEIHKVSVKKYIQKMLICLGHLS